jgi:hypothetical protein
VEGLLMPGQRKSIEPMAARLGVDAQSLQQLVVTDQDLLLRFSQDIFLHVSQIPFPAIARQAYW